MEETTYLLLYGLLVPFSVALWVLDQDVLDVRRETKRRKENESFNDLFINSSDVSMDLKATSDLLLQSSHPLLQVELQTFVGLCEESVHSVWEPLVMLLVHFFPLSSLKTFVRSNVHHHFFPNLINILDTDIKANTKKLANIYLTMTF